MKNNELKIEGFEVPKSWIWVKHSDIADINPKLPFEQIDNEREVSFIPMRFVEEESNTIHLNELRKYREVKKGFTSFTNNDVLFAKITPCMENGKCAIAKNLKNEIGIGSTEFHVSRPYKGILSKIIFYFIVRQQFRREAAKHMTGSVGQKRVPTQFFREFSLPLPPFAEQHRIVAKIEELFSSLDKGIESLKTAQQQLKIYRQAVLKYAFEGKLTNKNVNGELSEGWKWQQIKEITSILGDGLHGTPTYTEEGEYYFINGNNLSDGKIVFKKDTKQVDVVEYKKYNKPLTENTIFVSINGTIGNTAFYNGEKIILGKSACYFNVMNTIDKKYIRYCITSQRFINYAHKYATGSTIKNVGLKAMREFKIPLPPVLEEQHRIVKEIESRLSVCDKIEESIKQSLAQAEALRQSILKKAFEGKLVLQDPNDEPASKLLERIIVEKEKAAAANAKAKIVLKAKTRKKQ